MPFLSATPTADAVFYSESLSLTVFTPTLAAITPLQIGMMVVYMVGLVAISFAFKKLNKNSDDYFRAGCQGSWWLVGMSSYMMSFSAYTFTGLAGVAYEAGFTAWTQFFANIIGFALAGLFAAGWLRQLRVTTAAEVVRDRYGKLTEQVYSWQGAIFGLMYASLGLLGVSLFASTVFGISVQTMILAVGITVLIYSLVGGRWAVMGTDFAQGIILVGITFLVGFLALDHIGGFGGLLEAIREQGLEKDFAIIKSELNPEKFPDEPNKYTAIWVLASMIGLTMQRVGVDSAPHYFSARDGKHARGAAWFVCIIMSFSTVIFFIPAMVARLSYSAAVESLDISKPAEAAYAVASMELLPDSLMGLMLIAIFAATMSMMDSGLNQQAAVVVKNIYPAICRWRNVKPMTGNKLLLLGQATTLCAGIIIICLSFYFHKQGEGKGVFEQLLNIGALIGLPSTVPMIMGLFFRNQPSYAALVSIGFALVTAFTTKSLDMSFDVRVFSTFGLGALSFYLTRFLPEDNQEIQTQIKQFYERMHTPVDFEKEVGSLSGVRSQAGVLAAVSAIVGLLIGLLSFVTEGWGWDGKAGVLVIAAGSLLIGLLLWLYSRWLGASEED